MKKLPAFLFLFAVFSFPVTAQVTSDFTLTVTPVLQIPLGPMMSPGIPMYAPMGYGASMKAEYTMPFARWLYGGLVIDADFLPSNGFGSTLTAIGFGPEAGVQFFPIQRLGLRASVYGGLYLGILGEGSAWNGFAAGLVDASFLLIPSLSVGAGVQYKMDFQAGEIVYHGIGVSAGVRWHIGASTTKRMLEFTPQLAPVFPLFFSYYDKNPLGTVKLTNTGKGAIENVTVSFYVKQFMDQPKICWQTRELPQGESATVPVYALFNQSIFGVTEGTKAAGEITVAYRSFGSDAVESYPLTVTVNNRNAMSWDDTNKAAAFVTAKDPTLLAFAKKLSADSASKMKPAISTDFRTALALFQAMKDQGIGYAADPASSYSSLSENKAAIDYLQFPMQTFTYKGGDCDDLSILYAALCESVGIPAAFITVPGHIFMAFNADIRPAQARALFSNPADLILMNEETWIPVEVTMVKDGFLKAWKEGAKEWRTMSSSGQTGFFPISEAWKTYEPVSSSEVVKNPAAPPDPALVLKNSTAELAKVLAVELDPRVAELKKSLQADSKNTKVLNALGVLYARFGLYTEAEAQFNTVKALKGDIPAATLTNLGNISYLGSRYKEAVEYFKSALQKDPNSVAALLGLLLSAYKVGDTQTVDVALAALKKVDPASAEKYSYMGSGTEGAGGRAASANPEISLWGDEE